MVETKQRDPIEETKLSREDREKFEALLRQAKREYFGSAFKWPEMQEVQLPRDSVLAKISQYLNSILDSNGSVAIFTVHSTDNHEELRSFLIGTNYTYSNPDKPNTVSSSTATYPRIRLRIPRIFTNQPEIDVETPDKNKLKIVDFLSPENPAHINQVIGIMGIIGSEPDKQFDLPILSYSNREQPSYKINKQFL